MSDISGVGFGKCDRCDGLGIGCNDDGVWLCENCMFEEAVEQSMPKIVEGEEFEND